MRLTSTKKLSINYLKLFSILIGLIAVLSFRGENSSAFAERNGNSTTYKAEVSNNLLAVTINVFEDFDNDGTDDGALEPGVAGLTVTAYDDAGIATVLTDNGDGSYTLPGAGGPYRIEVTGLPSYLQPGVVGTPTTFFLNDGQTANVPLTNPCSYFVDAAATDVIFACFVDNSENVSSTTSSIVRFDYNDTSSGPGDRPNRTQLASFSQVGSIWGLAYQPIND